jgi:low temperature requirement protein LtrA
MTEGSGAERRASWLELFFDLCFVVSVGALAVGLHKDPTTEGVLRFVLLFIPVWWAWMGYTWFLSALPAEDRVVRVGVLAAMLGVIALAAAITAAPDDGGTAFAVVYAGLFALLAALFGRAWPGAGAARPFFARYALGDLAGAGLWLASAALAGDAALVLRIAAMTILMATPVVAVLSIRERAFDAPHIRERYGLFTIIVLGESIVATVAGTRDAAWSLVPTLTAATGFVIGAAVWWVYFERIPATVLRRDRVAAAFVWGYGHALLFAGIAAAAVGVEFAVEAEIAGEALAGWPRAILGGGIAAFLAAIAIVQAATARRADAVVGVRVAGAAGGLALAAAPITTGGLVTTALAALVLLAVALGETFVSRAAER